MNGTQISLVDHTELSQKSSTKTLMFEEVRRREMEILIDRNKNQNRYL